MTCTTRDSPGLRGLGQHAGAVSLLLFVSTAGLYISCSSPHGNLTSFDRNADLMQVPAMRKIAGLAVCAAISLFLSITAPMLGVAMCARSVPATYHVKICFDLFCHFMFCYVSRAGAFLYRKADFPPVEENVPQLVCISVCFILWLHSRHFSAEAFSLLRGWLTTPEFMPFFALIGVASHQDGKLWQCWHS